MEKITPGQMIEKRRLITNSLHEHLEKWYMFRQEQLGRAGTYKVEEMTNLIEIVLSDSEIKELIEVLKFLQLRKDNIQ